MEEVKQSMCELMDMFNTRMNTFHEELHKTPASTTTSGLAAEFQSFRQFITTALNSLQQQVEMLAKGLDRIDMHGRRKMLLLHGVPEQKDEDTADAAVRIITTYIKDPERICTNDIARCNRMGRLRDKPRPILLKFKDHSTRTKVWFSKAKLKGSGYTLSEFLTKTRHDVFMAARQRVGVARCWTRDGCVVVQGADGKQSRVVTLAELNQVCPATQLHGAGGGVAPKPSSRADKPVATTARPQRASKK